MKTYGGVHVWIHIFLTSAPRPDRFTSGEIAPESVCGEEKNLTMPGIKAVPPRRSLSRLLKRRIRIRGRDCGGKGNVEGIEKGTRKRKMEMPRLISPV
jgi:hypothetical protein